MNHDVSGSAGAQTSTPEAPANLDDVEAKRAAELIQVSDHDALDVHELTTRGAPSGDTGQDEDCKASASTPPPSSPR
jgi:hypothetical protein